MTTHNSQYSAETTHPDKQESSPAPTAAGTTASNVSTTGNATTPFVSSPSTAGAGRSGQGRSAAYAGQGRRIHQCGC
ncbi:hypothetical protein GBB06_06805, partial [Bifidobacterium longum]